MGGVEFYNSFNYPNKIIIKKEEFDRGFELITELNSQNTDLKITIEILENKIAHKEVNLELTNELRIENLELQNTVTMLKIENKQEELAILRTQKLKTIKKIKNNILKEYLEYNERNEEIKALLKRIDDFCNNIDKHIDEETYEEFLDLLNNYYQELITDNKNLNNELNRRITENHRKDYEYKELKQEYTTKNARIIQLYEMNSKK